MGRRKLIPKTAKRLPHRVLREGEATGHRHVATAPDVVLFDLGDGTIAARMPSGSAVRHEEHKTVILPAGDKVVAGTQEYDHFAEEAREVLD